MALRRAPRLPPDAAAHLARADRPLASARLADGDWAVVTTRAIAVVGPDAARWRHPWHEVDHGTWDAEARTVTIRWVEARPEEVLAFDLEPRHAFLVGLRERVQASVVHVVRLQLDSGTVVRAVVRRDEAGALISQVIAIGALSGTPDELREIDGLEARARQAVGLPI